MTVNFARFNFDTFSLKNEGQWVKNEGVEVKNDHFLFKNDLFLRYAHTCRDSENGRKSAVFGSKMRGNSTCNTSASSLSGGATCPQKCTFSESKNQVQPLKKLGLPSKNQGTTPKKVRSTLKKSGYNRIFNFVVIQISTKPDFSKKVWGGINTCLLPFRKFSFSSLAEKNEKNFVLLFIYVINSINTLLKTKTRTRTPPILPTESSLWIFIHQLKEKRLLKNE